MAVPRKDSVRWASSMLAGRSPLSRMLWTGAVLTWHRTPIWIDVPEELIGPLADAVELLGSPDDVDLVMIGADGPTRRLTLLSSSTSTVVKIACGPSGIPLIAKERENLRQLAAHGISHLGPVLVEADRSPRPDVLVTGLIGGAHPRWNDPDVARWILQVFRKADGTAVCHNDLVPWNVISGAPNSYHVIDWEACELARPLDAQMNLLDFILRGAAAAGASERSVKAALARVAGACTLHLDVRTRDAYFEHRRAVAASSDPGQADALLARSLRLADAVLN